MYCPRSLKWLGSVLATALTEPFFWERWLPCRNCRCHTRSLIWCDCGDAPWETIGETVMLVCPFLAARVSALACPLARSLDWVPRCSSSHVCSGSDIWKERVSSTELRPVPSAGLHKLSAGRYESRLAIPRQLGTIASRSERLLRECRDHRGSDYRRNEEGSHHADPGSEPYVRH